MARFASQKRHTTSIMHRFKFRLTCRAKDALFMHRAIMSSMDQVLLLCPRPLISLYVSIWASPLDLWYPRPRFRAWTGIGTAGAHHDAGLPDVAGAFYSVHSANGSQYTSGAFTQSQGGAYFAGGNSHAEFGITFRASNSNKTYGASPTVMPTSVDLPICLYLGNSA